MPIHRVALGNAEGAVLVRDIRRINPAHVQQGGAAVGQVLKWNGSAWAPANETGGGATAFTALTDTFSSYSGLGGYFIRVNSGETALEAVSPATVLSAIGAAAVSHQHVIADTTGLQSALDGKAALAHLHAISDVTGLQTQIDAINAGRWHRLYNQTLGSAQTTWAVGSVMTPSYQSFQIEFINIRPTTAGANLLLFTSSDNGATWGSAYHWTRAHATTGSSGAITTASGAGTASMPIVSAPIGSVAVSGVVEIRQGAATAPSILWRATYWQNSPAASARVEGSAVQGGPVNAFYFQFSTGDIAGGARLAVYGRST